jgi:hypothetical protein
MIPTHMLCDLDDPRMDSAELERIVTAHIRAPSTLLEASVLPTPSKVSSRVQMSSQSFSLAAASSRLAHLKIRAKASPASCPYGT